MITQMLVPAAEVQAGDKVLSTGGSSRRKEWLEVTQVTCTHIESMGEFDAFDMITIQTRVGWCEFEVDDMVEIVIDDLTRLRRRLDNFGKGI